MVRPRRALAFAPLLSLLLLTGVVPADAGAAHGSPHRAAHGALTVTGYAESGTPAAVVARNAPGLATLTADGVDLASDGASVSRPDASVLRLARAAHAHGLRAELLMSNYSDRIGDFDPRAADALLGDPSHLRSVAAAMARSVARGHWDGVNVDLELVPARDAAGLVRFVRALQAAMPARRTVSIDVSATTSLADYRRGGYDLAPLGRAVDVLQLMAYDQHGPTWSGPGPIGALSWQRASVRALLRRVPARKVDLGFGGYGYTWPAKGTGRTGRTVTDAGARALVARDGVDAVWHRRAGEWSAVLADGTRMWWSDARSYRLRLGLARRLDLHGLAVWRLGSADTLPRP